MTELVPGVLLLGYVLVTGFVAPRLLVRAAWPHRAPRLGVGAWLTLAFSTLAAALLFLATLAVPVPVAGHGLVDWLSSCLGRWRHYYGPTTVTIAAVGAVLFLAALARLGTVSLTLARTTLRLRRRLHRMLALFDSSEDVVVVPHPVACAYCVPGSTARIVLTDAAVQVLGPDQMRGVLAHERAHLRGRHSLLVGVTTVLHQTVPGLPAFAYARTEVAHLVEVLADEAASRVCAPRRLALALVALAGAGPPIAGALAAAGSDALRRARRLTAPPPPVGRMRKAAVWLTLALVALFPVAVVGASLVVSVEISSREQPSLHVESPHS